MEIRSDWREGVTVVEGFRFLRGAPVPDIRAVAYELEHVKTGAKLLHLHSMDTENCFAVTFPTPPPDSTGVPHILEHSVLGGSRRFPVREPFFEMVKMSMATFINAFTAQTFTSYPIATNVRKDFFNLVEVYLDAVFHPQLTRQTFQREGHHLRLADNGDPSSALTVSGIVYNEMKGYYSMPETLAANLGAHGLFAGTHLGLDSGGDPDRITDLTYEQFLAFHAAYYHPSNALIFTYGDIPTEDHLRALAPVLNEFGRAGISIRLPQPPRWTEPRRIEHAYPIGAGDDPARRTFHTINWWTGSALQPDRVVDWAVLGELLFGNESSPLKKALIDARLGEDIFMSGAESMAHEATFHVGIKGSEPGAAEAFSALVRGELERLAARPFEPERVAAAYQQLAYHHLEVSSQYPVKVLWETLAAWPLGADPLLFLGMRDCLDASRRRYETDPGLFSRMLREGLLDNPHRVFLTLRPDAEAQARGDREFTERMAAAKSRMSADEVARVAREAAELEEAQGRPNSPESLARLPQLHVSDLPRVPRHVPTTAGDVAGVRMLANDVFANGVNYLELNIDLCGMDLAAALSLPRYCDAFRKMGAAGQTFEQIAMRRAACTGSLHCGWFISRPVDEAGRSMFGLRFGMKTLDAQAPAALALLGDILFGLDPRDPERLRDVLTQSRAGYRTVLVNDGLGTARRHACRGLTPESALDHALFCRSQLIGVEDTLAAFDRAQEPLMNAIVKIRDLLRDRSRWTVSFTGSEAVLRQVKEAIASWARDMPCGCPARTRPCPDMPPPRREGLVAPLKVAHCVQAMPGPYLMHPASPLLNLGLYLLRFDFFLPEIRFKGNAYGAGIGFDDALGSISMHSYDDPRVCETLAVFDRTLDVVRRAEWTQTDIDRAIIGSAKAVERPIRPGEATSLALARDLRGDTNALREQRYARGLAATPASVKQALLDALEAGRAQSSLCVASSREKLEAANRELGSGALALSSLLP